MAFSNICLAVTVECSKPDQPHGIAHAADFIRGCLQLFDLPSMFTLNTEVIRPDCPGYLMERMEW